VEVNQGKGSSLVLNSKSRYGESILSPLNPMSKHNFNKSSTQRKGKCLMSEIEMLIIYLDSNWFVGSLKKRIRNGSSIIVFFGGAATFTFAKSVKVKDG